MSKLQDFIQELCPNGVEYKKLGDILDYEQPTQYIVKSTEYDDSYNTPVLTAGQTFILGYTNEENGVYKANKDYPTIIFDDFTTSFHWVDFNFKVKSSAMKMLRPKPTFEGSFKYIFYAMECIQFEAVNHTRHWISKYSQFEIPLPHPEVQEEIVKILDRFAVYTAELQAELQARKEQYEYYRNLLLNFNHAYGAADEQQKKSVTTWGGHSYEIQWKTLGEMCMFENGKGHEKYINENGSYIVINSKYISTSGKVKKYSNMQLSPLYKDMILLVMSDLPNGKALAKCFLVDKDNRYTLNQRIGGLTIKDNKVTCPKFLYYILDRNKQLLVYDNGVDQTNLRKGDILKIEIPIPPLELQERIVAILDKFETLVNDLSQGLPAEIAAVQEQYEYYRNKLLTFKQVA